MPHRDDNASTTPPRNAQSLKTALDWLLQSADFHAVRFRDDASLSPRGFIVTALLWAWSGKKTFGRRFAQAVRVARNVEPAEILNHRGRRLRGL